MMSNYNEDIKNKVVFIGNSLANSYTKKRWNKYEKKLLCILLEKTSRDRDKDDFSIYEIDVYELINMLEIADKKPWNIIKNISENMQSHTFTMQSKYDDHPESIRYENWFDFFDYSHTDKKIRAKFKKFLIKDIFAIKEFVKFNLKHVLNIDNIYSIQMYITLKSYLFYCLKKYEKDDKK